MIVLESRSNCQCKCTCKDLTFVPSLPVQSWNGQLKTNYLLSQQQPRNKNAFLEIILTTVAAEMQYKYPTMRMDMDVNEYERLSNFTLRLTVKEQRFYRCSAFHRHSRNFNNERKSQPKMGVKRLQFYLNESLGKLKCIIVKFYFHTVH